MYNIRRVFLDYVGYDDAWFENVEIPLFDSQKKEIESSIISLTNGGGKTTLLSLIFSCFIPDKRYFVQHLQKPHHKFEDYFKEPPGLILIELNRPTGENEIADDYPWVIGQYVSVHQESLEDDRTYFAFKSSKKLSFDDVPYVSQRDKGDSFITNTASVKRWIDKVKGVGDAFFYSHQNQTEWNKFLNTTVQIDTWTLSKQVDFCRAEGGIDAFMNFRSEKDFLKQFFHMVMPPGKSQEVRNVVADALNKLRKRPEYEKNRSLLNEFKERLVPFVNDAGTMVFTEKTLSNKKHHAARLHYTLNQVLKSKTKEIENKTSELNKIEEIKDNLQSEYDTTIKYSEGLRSLNYHGMVTAGNKALEHSRSELAIQRQYKSQIEAAIILYEVRSIEAKIKDLQSSIEQAGSDITPFQQALSKAAGIYLTKLKAVKQKKVNEKSAKDRAITDTDQKKQALRNEITLSTAQQNSLSSESGKLEEKIELRNQKQARLIKKGIIQQTDDIWELIKEISELIKQAEKDIAKSEEEKQVLNEKIDLNNTEINQINSKIGEKNAMLESIQKNIKKCVEKKEALRGNSILFQLSDGDEKFDPGSSKLSRELSSFLIRKEDERSELQLKLNHLIHQIAFIEDTESLLMDTDAKNALTFIRENGIAQAEFYPDFLSKSIGDPMIVKTVIETDPGRFLGIMVKDSATLDQVSKIKDQIETLEKPVMVSVQSENLNSAAFTSPRDVIIMPPKNGDVYDKEKVQEKLAALSGEKKSLDERLQKNSQFHQQIQETQQQLKIYLEAYGPEVQTRLQFELDRAQTDLIKHQNQLDDLVETKTILINKHNGIEQNQVELSSQKTELENRLEMIRDFYRDSEKQFEDTYKAFIENTSKLEAISEKIKQAEKELASLDEIRTGLSEGSLHLALVIDTYQVKINGISEYDPIELSNDQQESHQTEADLENKYKARLEAYENALSDKGLDRLKASISVAKENLANQLNKYDGQKKDLIEEDITQLVATEKDDLFKLKDETDTQIEQYISKNARLLTQLEQIEKDQKEFESGRKHPKYQYDGDELSTEDINDQIAINQEKMLDSEATIKRHDEATKDLINTISSLKGEKNKSDMLLEFLKKHVPDQPEQEYETLILPNSQDAIKNMVTACDQDIDNHREKYDQAYATAFKSYQKVIEIVQKEEFREIESRMVVELTRNPFEDACQYAGNHLKFTEDRILTLTDEIEKTRQDLEICLDHLKNHTQTALSKINSATKHARIPADVPDLGNRKILRIETNLSGISTDQRRIQLEGFLNDLITSQRIPDTSNDDGDELTAEAIIAITKAKNRQGTLGIKIIKLSQNLSYTPINQIKGSGGESMTAALLLYLVLAQMRMESLIGGRSTPGGFLLLDNPFARATTPQLVEPQVQLAEKLGFQLIYATAIKDFNAQSCFSHIVQLRKVAHDRTYNRTHVGRVNIESAEFTAREL
jgi:chromosome segregation ATPase